MCLWLLVHRQGILAAQGDSCGRRGAAFLQLLPQGKMALIKASVLFCFLLHLGMEIAEQSIHSKPTISATSKSHMSSEMQRGKIILGCTFVLIKSIKSFRATAAYEWEKSEFYAKSIFKD